MQCKGCQSEIVEDQYRLVAEWPFCLTCYERLTAKPSRAKAEPAAAPATEPAKRSDEAPAADDAARSAPQSREAKGQRCIACERTLSPGEDAPFGICAQCRTSLIAEPFRKILEQDAREATAREQAAAARSAPTAEPLEIVPVGILGKKTCAQCGRRLLEPGGYHVIDGRWFCPPCANALRTKSPPEPVESPSALPQIPAAWGTPVAVPRAPPAQAHASTAVVACDACERPLAAGDAEPVEGFSLCRPCVSVDIGDALLVARARHRARLRKLREELAG